jgi:hypothetical protein
MEELRKWSNPQEVRRLADKYLGKDVPIYVSNRKDKKYMLKNPQDKWVHFGQLFYEDFTHHKDEKRRELFRKRNHKWANNPKWTASSLSYHLLW